MIIILSFDEFEFSIDLRLNIIIYNNINKLYLEISRNYF